MEWKPADVKAPPLLKWVGGKSALLPELAKRVPRTFRHYVEPFAGGAALFFWLAEVARACPPAAGPPWAKLSDRNAHLIDAYTRVRERPDVILSWLRRYAHLHARARPSVRYPEHPCYYRTRAAWNAGKLSGDQRAAAFLYLNRTCFNGIWRVNKQGAFNVPAGRYRNPTIADADRINACSFALKGALLTAGDWAEAIAGVGVGDVVYFDPPYDPLSETANFTAYTQDGFGVADHEALAAAVHRLARQGVRVIVSNSDTPLVRRLYKGLQISRVKMARSLSCKGDQRHRVGELLITGGA